MSWIQPWSFFKFNNHWAYLFQKKLTNAEWTWRSMLIKQSLSVSSPPTRHKAIFKSALHSKKSAATAANGLSEDFEGRPFFLPLTLVTPRCAHLGHISFLLGDASQKQNGIRVWLWALFSGPFFMPFHRPCSKFLVTRFDTTKWYKGGPENSAQNILKTFLPRLTTFGVQW